MMSTFYNLTVKQVLDHFHSSPQGLSKDDILPLRKKYGENILKETAGKTKFAVLLSQFKDVMIIILLIAAAISFASGEYTDGFVILAIISANAWMSFAQENNAKKSIRLLKNLSPQFTLVLRNNIPVKIETAMLVPGDIIILAAGDAVPADARLIKISAFKTDESSLTGESQSLEKTQDAVTGKNAVPGDQANMVFKGTHVSTGSAKAVVIATGMNTELGKIAGMLKGGEQKTPLQKRLTSLSKQLAVIVIIVCTVIFGFSVYHGLTIFGAFLTALSLAVAALPEALPAVVTIALANGARRMAKQNALMKNLPAVETLGSVTYICTDKTGTLTQNKMTVEKFEATANNKTLLLQAMMLNNEIRFAEKGLIGDSTEIAMVEYAIKNEIAKAASDIAFPPVAKLPFDSQRMLMSTLHKHEEKWILFVKGAPAKIIEKLILSDRNRSDEWLNSNRQWAAEGLRVLFFAFKIFDTDPGEIKNSIEADLHFLGIVAMIDPPREEAIEAIAQCHAAGIKTVMITGDQALTAGAIAKRLGFIGEDANSVRTGADLMNLSGNEFNHIVKNTSVYARVSPQQKLDIVKALQTSGEFVAMTGDGVNDAPSLKKSDIGIAMGITGTDVSKEAADMILLDDNFATIVKAVKEGRRIYDNIRKFILYVLSCNLAEILTIFIASLAGFAIPMLPIHILWINLVTDGLPGIALIGEPAEDNAMKRAPRRPGDNIFAGDMIKKILLSGAAMTVAALSVQYWAAAGGYDIRVQQTMVFTTLCFVQLGNALSVRSVHRPILSGHMFSNKIMWLAVAGTVLLQSLIVYLPAFQKIFKTGPLDLRSIVVVGIATMLCTGMIESIKYFSKKAN